MSTRSVLAIFADKQYRLGSYVQYDGYPSGIGVDLLAVLRKINLNTLRFNAVRLQWMTEQDYDEVEARIRSGQRTEEDYPELSSDTGADLIRVIAEKPWGLKVPNQLGFARSQLCKWGYVLDFDTNLLEVYKYNSDQPLTQDDRFYQLSREEWEWEDVESPYPLKKVAQFSLLQLPTKDEFLHGCKE